MPIPQAIAEAAERIQANCWDTYLKSEPGNVAKVSRWHEAFDALLTDARKLASLIASQRAAEEGGEALAERIRKHPYPWVLTDSKDFRHIWSLACEACAQQVEKAALNVSREGNKNG